MKADKTKRTMNKADVWLEVKMAKHTNGWLYQCIVGQTLQRLYADMYKRTDSVPYVRLTNDNNGCTDNWLANSLKIQTIRCVIA